jgi:hypothetical protein
VAGYRCCASQAVYGGHTQGTAASSNFIVAATAGRPSHIQYHIRIKEVDKAMRRCWGSVQHEHAGVVRREHRLQASPVQVIYV